VRLEKSRRGEHDFGPEFLGRGEVKIDVSNGPACGAQGERRKNLIVGVERRRVRPPQASVKVRVPRMVIGNEWHSVARLVLRRLRSGRRLRLFGHVAKPLFGYPAQDGASTPIFYILCFVRLRGMRSICQNIRYRTRSPSPAGQGAMRKGAASPSGRERPSLSTRLSQPPV
jgi:hypothetical protein